MITTAIFTEGETTLTIEASEDLCLHQMGTTEVLELPPGTNSVVVTGGVFKLLSASSVEVTGDQTIHVASTVKNKDGSFPEPPKLTSSFDMDDVNEFFAEARSSSPPPLTRSHDGR